MKNQIMSQLKGLRARLICECAQLKREGRHHQYKAGKRHLLAVEKLVRDNGPERARSGEPQ